MGMLGRGENQWKIIFFILRCLAKKEEENYFQGKMIFPHTKEIIFLHMLHKLIFPSAPQVARHVHLL